MPMRYADEESVLHQLNQLAISDPKDERDVALAISIENAIADRLDSEIGRSYGVAPSAQQRVVRGAPWPGSSRLILTTPARSVTAVEVGGTWNGTDWSDVYAIGADGYRIGAQDRQGNILELERLGAYWPEQVCVTGVWTDQPILDVPKDLIDAATWLTVEEYRYRKTSPAGVEGPDGMTVRPRNPWNSEAVRRTIARHRVFRLVIP